MAGSKLARIALLAFVVGGAGLAWRAETALRRSLGAEPFAPPPFVPPWLEEHERALRWRYPPEEDRPLGLKTELFGPRREGTRRVLLLGDSVLYFSETPAGVPAPRVAQARLASGERPVEIVNAAVPGYTTFQELAFLKLHGLAMDPDEVVLGVVFNDVYSPYLHVPREEPYMELAADPRTELTRFSPYGLPGRLLGGSYLAHAAAERAEAGWYRLRGRPWYRFELMDDFHLAWKPWGWRAVAEQIAEMKTLLDGRGIPLSLLVFPHREQMRDEVVARDPDYVLRPQRAVRDIAEALSLPMRDLTGALRDAGGVALFTDDVHLGPEGNEVLATELALHLRGAP